MNLDLTGKVAVVTGGARGIGRATCKLLAEAGAAVVVNYAQNAQGAAEVVESIKEKGGRAISVQADVSDVEAVRRMNGKVIDAFGKVDILVNNAGIATASFVADMTDTDWERVVDVNLKGVFNCCREFLPAMIRQRGGRIINVASFVAHIGSYKHAHYAASKAGVIGFTRSLAREVAEYGITVNAVAPGRIETSMEPERMAREKASWIAETPLKRLGRPDEVGAAIVFLASDAASFITGETINVTGGLWIG